MDTGIAIAEYKDQKSQLTSLSYTTANTSSPLYLSSTYDGSAYVYDTRKQNGIVLKIPASSSGAPPWALSSCWGANGSSIFVGRRNSTGTFYHIPLPPSLIHAVDEFDFKMNGKYSRTLRMPSGSGIVSQVAALDDKQLLV